jgi:hypothetical protein
MFKFENTIIYYDINAIKQSNFVNSKKNKILNNFNINNENIQISKLLYKFYKNLNKNNIKSKKDIINLTNTFSTNMKTYNIISVLGKNNNKNLKNVVINDYENIESNINIIDNFYKFDDYLNLYFENSNNLEYRDFDNSIIKSIVFDYIEKLKYIYNIYIELNENFNMESSLYSKIVTLDNIKCDMKNKKINEKKINNEIQNVIKDDVIKKTELFVKDKNFDEFNTNNLNELYIKTLNLKTKELNDFTLNNKVLELQKLDKFHNFDLYNIKNYIENLFKEKQHSETYENTIKKKNTHKNVEIFTYPTIRLKNNNKIIISKVFRNKKSNNNLKFNSFFFKNNFINLHENLIQK